MKVLAVIATGIIVFSLLFESAKEKLSEHTFLAGGVEILFPIGILKYADRWKPFLG